MSEKVLVVTGGSRGIGAATARLAGQRGYSVAITYSGQQETAEGVVNEIRLAGGTALALRADAANENEVIAAFQTIEKELGNPTALFNNAGITGPICQLEDLELDVLDQVLAINVRGAFLAAREAVRRMSTRHNGQGGAIVNMSSRAGQLGGGGEWIHYAASKAAIDAMTIGLAREVGKDGIRVNAVAPGLIDTDIHERAGGGGRLERLLPGVPMARVGKPEEVAELVLSLLDPALGYVSGAIIPISGGR
ncbi:SDR family oxidoreductase [Modicisalibacter luteus]|uniref:SDR family oxidoreductase n=1 Tax=Modicisalibacter luteus TaxID=453962 RepID=A0ABV7M4T6_9GAMM|nr:SDR family oxidoreductase [Halomonas lutea]GHA87883.1 glucose-1-dehydrogenase [Halomonas lutea]